ncbi:hypothetical protein QEP15_15985 [Achromobacter mucicolens]|uniref:hypothetical protein n=1 Tax=Achromobacter mucicolens TaxID=1389922 RepID=UPI0024531454|nr:hypothetical protein [Achromobacter mucicolens]WGJ88855.1 hypothetical protein QEP15_15985 [Achromobacter mucicolens]
MKPSQVAVVEMPSTGTLELILQWGGIVASLIAAVGTVAAVFAAISVATRQRRDRDEEIRRAAEVAYWIILPEVVQLREVHFPVAESVLQDVLMLSDGQVLSRERAGDLKAVVGRMSMNGTRQVLDKLPLLHNGIGVLIAEVYGRFDRLKVNLDSIADKEEGMDLLFREHVRQILQRVERLSAVLDQTNIRS